MANNSIALLAKMPEFDSPLESQGKAMQIRNLMNQGQVQEMDMQQRRQAIADDGIAREAFAANPTDASARLAALARAPKAFAAERTALQNAEKVTADIEHTKANTKKAHAEEAVKLMDAAGQAMGFVVANPTLPNALSALDYLGRNGIYSPEDVAHYKEVVTKDPTQIKALAEQAFRGAVDAKEQLAKIDTRDLGGSQQTTRTDPVTGQQIIVSNTMKTQSPDSVANVAEQRRAHNMADARARDQNDNGRGVIIQTDEGPMLANSRTGTTKQIIGPDGKPVTRTKPLTEFQGKSAAFGDRAMAADAILGKIGDDYSPAGVNFKNAMGDLPLVGSALGSGANAMLSDNSQMVDQAKRDFINATLRQESGAAIGASEFSNAEKQYFPQPGDSKAVIKQKAENRKLVISGFKRSAGANAEFTKSAPVVAPSAALPTGWTVETH